MILMIDNYDSFTYNLVQYYRQLQETVLVVRNDCLALETVAELNPTLIVLSPGPGTPEHTGVCKAVIQEYKASIPILGICLGHQTIASVFGAVIGKAPKPMHGKLSPVFHRGTGVFAGLESPVQVTRYHSLIVDRHQLPDCLEITAWTAIGEIMGLRHREHLIEGVQFHPEAILTEHGLAMLANFLGRAKQHSQQRAGAATW